MGFRNPITTLVDQTARDAAAAAQSSANNALAVASARNHVFVQSNAPTTTTLDDLWINPANGYQIQSWNGSSWQPVAFGSAAIAANAITANLIAAGAIGAGQLAANAIDGKTITGATVHAGTLDTGASTTAPGLTVTQGGTTGPDITTTYGQVAFRDGFSGDVDATITRQVTVNPRSNATSGAGSLALYGGGYGGLGGPHAPTLTLGVEADSGGTYVGRARIDKPLAPAAGEDLAFLTVSSPFGSYPGYLGLQVRKDSSGVVHCWGIIRNNGTSAVSAVATIATGIPAALRPPVSSQTTPQVPSVAYSSSGGVARVDVTATGTLILAVGSVAASGYLLVNFTWPGPDLAIS